MTDTARDDLVEELQGLLLNAMETADEALDAAERRREAEVQAVTLNLLTERLNEQRELDKRMKALNGGMTGLQATVASLPRRQRGALMDQVSELANLVRQSLDGGPDRPLLLDELEKWTELRWGHAADKKVRTDRNRIKDFVAFAGNRPVNRYRYSDFQGFANLLARVPADYSTDPRIRDMTRQEAADYNDDLPPSRRHETLAGKAIDANYFSPLRMFFQAMGAEHEFRSPLADIRVSIPANAKESVERSPFTVQDLNIWFIAAAKEKRPDLRWLPLLGTLTGARVGELVFLQGKDVYEITPDLWVADLATELAVPEGGSTKRQIKNKSSRRLFALHEVFRETGFIAYCQSRQSDEWLFPQAFWHGKERVQDPAGAASKRLNLRLKEVGIHKKLENTFHSFRIFHSPGLHANRIWVRCPR